MKHNPNSGDPRNPSFQKSLEIYEKMLKYSRSFAYNMAVSVKREKERQTDDGQMS